MCFEDEAGQSLRADVPPSTLQDALRSKNGRLPSMDMICTYLEACGITEPTVIGEWVYTWRRLKLAEIEGHRRNSRRRLASVG